MRGVRHILHRTILAGVLLACACPSFARPSPAQALVEAARSQVGVTRTYDPAYVRLAFPGGDVPIDVGVHLLWREAAQAPGHFWAGFRFLTLEKGHRERLRQWIESSLPAS